MKKPNRFINKVFLHCSASDSLHHDNTHTITQWHLARGFAEIGYHFIITQDGKVHKGRDTEKIPAAQAGHNTGSIAICLTGENIFPIEQLASLKKLCEQINSIYNNITFHGHCEVSNKTCPVFDYRQVLNLDVNGKMMENKSILFQLKELLMNIEKLL